LVDRLGLPKTRDHRSGRRRQDILPRGRSKAIQCAVPLCGNADGADKLDDKDYYPPSQPPPPSSNPAPKQKKKKNDPNPKFILDRSFMKYIWLLTFDHDPFWKGKVPLYTVDNIVVFVSNFKKQLHFNFSATRLSKRQAEISASMRASQLQYVDLDVLPWDTSIATTNQSKMSHCILGDLLDCPMGSRFIVCIAMDADNI
jgi:hypothetical protein